MIIHMSTIISISVLASFATGFVCLLVVGIKWANSVKRDLAGEENGSTASRIICALCGTSFFDNPQLGLKDVLCVECKCPVCSSCALCYQFHWLCSACIKSRDEKTAQGDFRLKEFRQRFPNLDTFNRIYGQREADVRNLIEMLVENILGSCFENVPINCLSNDVSYLDFVNKFEGVLSNTLLRLRTSIQLNIDGAASNSVESPRKIELQLRRLFQQVIEEASKIDTINLKRSIKFNNVTSKTFEDILAIAILNKVTENVSLLTINETQSMSIKSISDTCKKSGFEKDYLSNLKIEAKIRELSDNTSYKTNKKIHKIIYPDLGLELSPGVNFGSKWEENWLFSKKNADVINYSAETNNYRSIVSMFVPSPTIHVSPKIGDASVDDVSDLSDLSDSEVEQLLS